MTTVSRGPREPIGPDRLHGLPGLSALSGQWDELMGDDGRPRSAARGLVQRLSDMGITELRERQDRAEIDILAMEIAFTVYSDGRGIDRAWPFDVIPRVIAAAQWRRIRAGLIQRLTALNMFIDDVYNDRRVIADGVFPADLLDESVNYRPECVGVRPRFGCGRTCAAATWFGAPTARCTCSRTTCACPRASATCSRTA